MIRYELSGRTALVTGAASGIGLATATMLGRNGARVAVNFLPQDTRGLEAIAGLRAAGIDAIAAPGNVADSSAAEAMVRGAIAALGRLDLLVNNAGTPGTNRKIEPRELDAVDEELWRTVVEVNLLSVFRCTKAAGDALR